MFKKFVPIFVLSLFLVACSPADVDGVVIDSSDDHLMLATELTLDEYDEIKNQTATEIQNNDVLGDSYYGLMNIRYNKSDEIEPGDYVEVWLQGAVQESYPSGARSGKVRVLK